MDVLLNLRRDEFSMSEVLVEHLVEVYPHLTHKSLLFQLISGQLVNSLHLESSLEVLIGFFERLLSVA